MMRLIPVRTPNKLRAKKLHQSLRIWTLKNFMSLPNKHYRLLQVREALENNWVNNMIFCYDFEKKRTLWNSLNFLKARLNSRGSLIPWRAVTVAILISSMRILSRFLGNILLSQSMTKMISHPISSKLLLKHSMNMEQLMRKSLRENVKGGGGIILIRNCSFVNKLTNFLLDMN